jgi:hypothetical protein
MAARAVAGAICLGANGEGSNFRGLLGPTIQGVPCELYRIADHERLGTSMATEGLSWSKLLGMGVVIAGQLAVGLGLGALVDSLADTAPVFLLVGLLLGIVGAVGYTCVLFRQYLKTSKS